MKYQEYKQISMCLLTVLIKDTKNCLPPPAYIMSTHLCETFFIIA